MARKSVIKSVLSQREFLSVVIAISNAFSWYFPLYLFFQSTLGKLVESTFLSVTFAVHVVAIIGSAIVGNALVKRFSNRNTLLSIWMFIGVIFSVLLVPLETFNMAYILVVSFLLGTSLGLGFPSCLAYFGDYGTDENRGSLAGVTFFASGVCILLIGLVLNFSALVVGALILAAWRGIGLLLFLFTKSDHDYSKESTIEPSYRSVILDRSFLLYLVPWIMFCLINFLEAPVVDLFLGKDFTALIPITEYGIGAFVALIGGIFADSVGRKPVVIFGFIILGVGYAVLGLFSSFMLSGYLYLILDGVAWGIFSCMFYLVIWSELARDRFKEKHYLIGVLPFIVSSYIQILFTPFAKLIDISTAFSLASLFLFLAVFPILLAPETLPERKIELRRLRKYVEKAKKVEDKHRKN